MSGFAGMMVSQYRSSATVSSSDPYWTSVQLLILGGETSGTTTIKDKSTNNYTITNNNSVTYSTTQTKFASTSLYFSGSTWLQIPTTTNLEMPGDFTWEAWIFPSNNSTYNVMIGASAIYSRIQVAQNGGLYWESDDGNSGNGVSVSSGYPPTGNWTVNAWQHIALTRSGSSWYFFKNGTQQGTTKTASFTPETTKALQIGAVGGGSRFTGYMEGIRYTKGVARYTSNFTAPTAIFPTS